MFLLQEARVRSLVGDLRSHMLQSSQARVPQLLSLCAGITEARMLWSVPATTEESLQCSERSCLM